ncbi:MAG: SagB/ThcOx family dehydrogenase [Planctomycetes bacterium]|nr:SagB/ThcOx family dehydrogenase [Planctomycetota bacterium]
MSEPREAAALAYHLRSKHHPRRFAASLGYLDWATQPEPFRSYAGAPRCELPLSADGVTARWSDLFAAASGRAPLPAAPVTREALAAFFELSLGLTAWKRAGDARWPLRANPSSGNLHPTEGWLVVPEGRAIDAGAWHYAVHDHALEQRVAFAAAAVSAVASAPASAPAGAAAPPGFAVALTSIHWREAWKYGERAFRYCQHDVGHALGALRFAAATLGWRAELLDELGDAPLERLLGLDRDGDFAHLAPADRETAETLLWIATDGAPVDRAAALRWLRGQVERSGEARYAGRANALSSDHVDWPAIAEVHAATVRAAALEAPTHDDSPSPSLPPPPPPPLSLSPPLLPAHGERSAAAALIRGRRSAVAFDPRPTLPAADLFALLDATLPRPAAPPFDLWLAAPPLHLLLFVHRVDGVASGLYLLERGGSRADPRDAADAFAPSDELRAALAPDAEWARVDGAPRHLPLFRLRAGDFRDSARIVSCRQEIAADSAFSLGMVARFAPELVGAPHAYRRLFWNAGLVGQALYLAAEAAGVRATGIGCYFDDLVHELLGLRDATFQSLYHFTVGTPVDDPRIASEPPYGHLGKR